MGISTEFSHATYSPEDDKLRIYQTDPDERVDTELFTQLKNAGFKRAPIQQLWVAYWSTTREDLCIELASTIIAEGTTLVERAEAKAARLDAIAVKRHNQSCAYLQAAERISKNIVFGQPILMGHHSQRRAERDQEKMKRAAEKSADCFNAIGYWQDRASGVEAHANKAASLRVKNSRVKKLLTKIRAQQTRINDVGIAIKLWSNAVDKAEQMNDRASQVDVIRATINTGSLEGYTKFRTELEPEDSTNCPVEFAKDMVERWSTWDSSHALRCIQHYLNRISYERQGLPDPARFSGEMRAPVLQTFARNQGAIKPVATNNGDDWTITTEVALPAHLSLEHTLTMTADEWCDLMVSSGYTLPAAPRRTASKKAGLPLINPTQEEAERLQNLWEHQARSSHQAAYVKDWPVAQGITQKQYSANSKGDYSQLSVIELDANGTRVWNSRQGKTPVCRLRVWANGGSSLVAPAKVIFLTDKPTKQLPVDWEAGQDCKLIECDRSKSYKIHHSEYGSGDDWWVFDPTDNNKVISPKYQSRSAVDYWLKYQGIDASLPELENV